MSLYGDETCVAHVKARTAWQQAVMVVSYVPRLLAVLVLVIYLPIVLAVGMLVVLTSPGPPFVKRAYLRSTEEGGVVYLYEFRTECWQTWSETPVGAFLRAADLHRIPRLANVILGEVVAGERVQPLNG